MASKRKTVHTLLKLADLVVVGVAFAAALLIGMGGMHDATWRELLQFRISVQHILFVAGYATAWHFVLAGWGLYRSFRLAPARREMRRLAVAVTMAVLPLGPAGNLLSIRHTTPTFIFTFGLLAFAFLVIERRSMRLLAKYLRRRGLNLRNAVIVGMDSDVDDMTAKLTERGDLGYNLLDRVSLEDAQGQRLDAEAVKNRLDLLTESEGLDEVFLVLPFDASDTLVRTLIGYCEERGIMVRVMTRIADLTWARVVVDEVAGQPVLSIFSGPPAGTRLAIKRGIDVVGATCGLIVLSPVMLIAALAIKLDSSGPVLFRQPRVGLNRRKFVTYKFRTMTQNADGQQANLEHMNEAEGPVFKIRNDPRITSIGEFLRRTSVDELPQLFNVIKGEMSLVGPRPLPVRDVEKMNTHWHKRRFAVKPGITCIWQAKSREPKFEEWIRSDMEYIDSWSLTLDFKILLKTIPAVLMRQGAH